MGVECKLDIRLVDSDRVRALVDLHYGDFVIKGFKVVDPGDGKPLWVGMPSRQFPAADGETQWVSTVLVPDLGRRKAFEGFVLKAYREELKKAGKPGPKREV